MKESILVGRTAQREVAPNYFVVRVDGDGRLEVVPIAGGVPFDMNLVQVLSAALTPANPVIVGVYDALGNRMPTMDIAARSGFQDVIDRWARQLGQVDLARVLGVALSAANPLIAGVFDAAGNRMPSGDDPARQIYVEGSGLNTNPERWLHDNHWEANEATINAAGVGGEQNLGAVVPALNTRRIRALHVRHAGTNNTVLTLLISGGVTKRSWDIQAQSTRVISSEDGWEFAAAEQPAVQTSDVTGGNTYVGAEGVEST